MKACLALAALLLAVGCCKPQVVYVPVPPPQAPEIQEPVYRTDKLTKADLPEIWMTCLALDLLETKAALKRALTYLEGTRSPKPTSTEAKK